MKDIINLIKEVASEANESSNPTKLYYGKVISIDPFEVEHEEGITLSEDFLVVSSTIRQKIFTEEIGVNTTVTMIREQGGQQFFVMDFLPSEVWTPIVPEKGEDGKDGVDGVSPIVFSVNASTYSVVFDENNQAKITDDITLTVTQENFDDEIIWQIDPPIQLSGEGKIRTLPLSAFYDNQSVKVNVNAGGYTDGIIISKVIDGSNAYTVILTNDNHSFKGDDVSANEDSTECFVMAFKGSERVITNIGTPTGMPIGMSVEIADNSTVNTKLVINVQNGMTQRSGTVTIPITVDSILFEKNFSYSIALRGEDGASIVSIVEQYALSESNTVMPEENWGEVYPEKTESTYIWTRSKITYSNGMIDYTAGFYDPSWEHNLHSIDVEYYLSTSSSVVEGGEWSTVAPLWENDKYMWTRTVSKDGLGAVIKVSNPSCIAGAKGEDGLIIDTIVPQYYLSTSKNEQLGGEWSIVRPEWVFGKYLWIRSIVTYTDGTVIYSGTHCDTNWEEISDNINGELLPLIKQNSTNIEKTGEEIRLEASSMYVRGDVFEQYKETAIVQTSEQIEFVRQNINYDVENLADTVTGNQEQLEEYIRFNGAEISLGRTDSDFGAEIDNTELRFTESGQKIAYVSNSKMHITEVEVEKQLDLMGFMWIKRANGNLSLIYVG